MRMAITILAAFSVAIWLYLLVGRGAFWLSRVADVAAPAVPLRHAPKVVAIVPARNEAAVVAASLGALLRQAYSGEFSVILVDDQSDDGTGRLARATAEEAAAGDRLTIVAGAAVPPGWTGKLWALNQGILQAQAAPEPADYLLLTDADIAYAPDALAGLVARAQAGGFVLTSLMAKLRCASRAERAFVPAFIFFFQMLYPFAWVNRAGARTAAAAGGSMLVARRALEAAGGIAAIRGALIDDCALARRLKQQGSISLGLTEKVRSLRACDEISDIRRMVARSAYAQLGYSPWALAATSLAMAVTFLAPPLAGFIGPPPADTLGLVAWCLMAVAFQPTLRFYRVSPAWGLALPLIAGAYLVFTLDSALQYHRGRGGMWKGRAQAFRSEPR
jgi:hopene-associated glycosyltransferase HpnB